VRFLCYYIILQCSQVKYSKNCLSFLFVGVVVFLNTRGRCKASINGIFHTLFTYLLDAFRNFFTSTVVVVVVVCATNLLSSHAHLKSTKTL